MAAGPSRGSLGSLTVAVGANTEGLTTAAAEMKKVATAMRSLATRVSRNTKKIEEGFAKAAKSSQKLKTETDKASASIKKQEALLSREIKTIASAEERTKSLTAAIRRAGASESQIRNLNAATKEFSREVKSAAGNTLILANAQTKLSRKVGDTRRRLSAFNSEIRKKQISKAAEDTKIFKDRMQELTKTIQIALGPLSGVASRVTAFAGLANKSTIAIAGFIGALIGLGFILKKTLQAGSAFEIQFKRIEAQLKLTGRAAVFSVEEVNKIAEGVADATLTNAKTARQAASALLFFNKVTKKDFKIVLNLAQSLSAVLGGDLVQSVKRIGRAIQDPNEGLSSLNRQLALLSPSEERVAKGFAFMGQEAKATAFIIDRLRSKLGDLGEQEAAGVAGAFDTLIERIGRFFEIAGKAGGILKPFTESLLNISKTVRRVNKSLADGSVSLRAFGKAIKFAGTFLEALVFNLGFLATIIGAMLAGAILGKLATAFTALTLAVRTGTFAMTLFNIAAGRIGLIIALGAAIAAAAIRFKLFGQEARKFTKEELDVKLGRLRDQLVRANEAFDRFVKLAAGGREGAQAGRIEIMSQGIRALRDEIIKTEDALAKLTAPKAKEKAAEGGRFKALGPEIQRVLQDLNNEFLLLTENVTESDKAFFNFLKQFGQIKISTKDVLVGFEDVRRIVVFEFVEKELRGLEKEFKDKGQELVDFFIKIQDASFEASKRIDLVSSAIGRIKKPDDLGQLSAELDALAEAQARLERPSALLVEATDAVLRKIRELNRSQEVELAADSIANYARKQKLANQIIEETGSTVLGTSKAFNEFNKQLFMLEDLRDEGFFNKEDTFNKQLQKIEIQLAKDTEGVQQFASTVSSGFAQGILQGEKLEDILARIGDRLAEAALQALIFRSIMSGFGSFLSPEASAATGSDISSAPDDFRTLSTPTVPTTGTSTVQIAPRRGGSANVTNLFIDAREADPGVEARVARAISIANRQNRAITLNTSFEARRRA